MYHKKKEVAFKAPKHKFCVLLLKTIPKVLRVFLAFSFACNQRLGGVPRHQIFRNRLGPRTIPVINDKTITPKHQRPRQWSQEPVCKRNLERNSLKKNQHVVLNRFLPSFLNQSVGITLLNPRQNTARCDASNSEPQKRRRARS